MPSRRENKRRQRERQEVCERSEAAHCIQEFWRSARSKDRLVTHVSKWQVRPKTPPVAFEPVAPRSCMHGALREKRVQFCATTRVPVSSMDVLRTELTCRICQELVVAPMFASCCDSAAAFGAVCYGCAYKFLQLDKCPEARGSAVRSWSLTCKGTCTFEVSKYIGRSRPITLESHHFSAFVDRLRDSLGDSTCFACAKVFTTTAALRRHLRQKCPNVSVPCLECAFYGPRRKVRKHRVDVHEYVKCPCCGARVQTCLWKAHVEEHKQRLSWTQTTISGNYNVTVCGECYTNAL